MTKSAVVTAVAVDPLGVMADSDPTVVAFIVQVETVTCDTPYNAGRYTDDVLVQMSTPTPGATIDYRIANTGQDQVYAPSDVPKKYEATGQLSSTARKVGLELSAVTLCPYCMQYGKPYVFSQAYYGWSAATTTAEYPSTYPADLGGSTDSARENSDGADTKALQIIVKQRSEVRGIPAAQEIWTKSTGNTYVTLDFCCQKALSGADVPLASAALYTALGSTGDLDTWALGAGTCSDNSITTYAGCTAVTGNTWTDDCKWVKYYEGDCGPATCTETAGTSDPQV